MPKIQQTILESFYKELEKSGRLDTAAVAELRNLFQSKTKLKAEDFVQVLSNSKSGKT